MANTWTQAEFDACYGLTREILDLVRRREPTKDVYVSTLVELLAQACFREDAPSAMAESIAKALHARVSKNPQRTRQ
jgi:hypothetical protein